TMSRGVSMTVDFSKIFSDDEHELVEFKENIKDSKLLARYLSAFSNTKGGIVIVGVREPDKIIGVDENSLSKVFEIAKSRLTGSANCTLEFQKIDDNSVGIIKISPSSALVGTPEGIFQRRGDRTHKVEPIPSKKMESIVKSSPKNDENVVAILDTLSKQTAHIADLTNEIKKLNSPWRKALWVSVGALATACARYFFPDIISFLGSISG